MTEELSSEIKKIKDVSLTKVIGGRNRQLKVELDKDKMAESSIDALNVMQMIQANNGSSQSGSFDANDTEYLLTTGQFLRLCRRCRKFGGRNFSKYACLPETNCKSRRWSAISSQLCEFWLWKCSREW